ncbi:MAG: hypothetical protein ACRC9H_10685, partial [Aeromonas veronii]
YISENNTAREMYIPITTRVNRTTSWRSQAIIGRAKNPALAIGGLRLAGKRWHSVTRSRRFGSTPEPFVPGSL